MVVTVAGIESISQPRKCRGAR